MEKATQTESHLDKKSYPLNLFKKEKGIIFFFFIAVFLFGCAPSRAQGPSTVPTKVAPSSEEKISFPVLELPIPQNEAEKNYLGISGSGIFKITQITGSVLIVEVFNMYCPHCQNSAPMVNELYQTIEARPDLKEKIKLIGVGIGNTPYEIGLFRTKYKISFPLFPDQDNAIGKNLGVTGTPTFIGAKKNPDGTMEEFYFKSGEFSNVNNFLDLILKQSELK